MMGDSGRVTGSTSLRSPEPISVVSAHSGDDPAREWQAVLNRRMRSALASFPADVVAVIDELGCGEYVQSADYIATITRVPEKRVKEIQRGLKALGFADFGVLCDVDRLCSAEGYVAKGSGYWLSGHGETLSTGISAAHDAIAMEARQGGDGETRLHPEDDSAGRRHRPDTAMTQGEEKGR